MKNDLDTRAREISEFLNVSLPEATHRLQQGFHHNHALVAQDFKNAGTDVNNPESLLNWYKTTHAYIWELSAYHLEEGFNYMGMCQGLSSHCSSQGLESVLALGDGIGDLTLTLLEYDLYPTYHDLRNSKTADFALMRFGDKFESGLIKEDLTSSFDVALVPDAYDAVIALDFFEHLPNVEQWVWEVYTSLHYGGMFLAQNAFGIGDAEHGDSIPMHLSVNNKYVEGWDSLLEYVGFENQNNGWWKKP